MPDTYLISLLNGDGMLLHRAAAEIDPVDYFGDIEQALSHAQTILDRDADLANKTKRCEVKRATPEEMAELGLEDSGS